MKKGLIAFATLALATVALVSCGGGKELDSLTITNKDELQAVWHANDGNVREINLQVKPDGKININKEVSNGNLTIESSASDVVSANGLNLTALKEGTSTVSVKYKKVLYDSVALTIAAEENCITLYGTTHAGTEADPLTAADACIVAGKVGTTATPKAWVVKDVVYGIKSAYDPSFGNLSVFIGDKTNSFLVYRLAVTSETQVEVNDTITIKTAIYNYNGNTPETSGNIELLDVTKGEPAKDPDPIKDAKTVHAGTLADPFDGADALKFCKYIGETTSISKYYVKDVVSTVDINTSYGNATADITVGEEKFTLYRFYDIGGAKFTEVKFEVGDTIEVKSNITQYKHTAGSVDYRAAGGELISITPGVKVDPTAVSFKDGDSLEMNVNTGRQLELTWEPLNAKKEATWTSDNTEVASVEDGFVSGLKNGVANITVTSSAVSTVTATIKVTVVDVDDPVKFETEFTAGTEYYGGVYSTGLGKTLLACGALSSYYIKAVDLLADADKVKLETATGGFNLKIGSNYLNAVVSGSYVNPKFEAAASTVWSYDSTLKTFTTKVTVSETEKTYFIGSNKTYDTLSLYTVDKLTGEEASLYYGFGLMLPASFSTEVVGLDLEGEKEVTVGSTITLKGVVRPRYISLEVKSWQTEDEKIATVKDGVVTGVAEGKVLITLNANGFSRSKEITVKPAQVGSITLDFSKDNGLPTSTPSENVSFTISGLEMATNKGYQGVNYTTKANEYLMLKYESNAAVWNTAATSKTIKSIEITTGSASSKDANYSVTFATSVLEGQVAQASATEGKVIGTGASYVFSAASVANAKFFNISAFTKNCQVAKIVINLAA